MEAATLLRVCVSCLLAWFVTGCAAVGPVESLLSGGGGTPASDLDVRTATSVRLQEGNFVTVRTNVVGSSKGFKLLGLITLYPATLNKAMGRLYNNAEVETGRPQTFAHFIVEHSGIYVILFSIPKVTVRADLIEFLPSTDEGDQQQDAPHQLRVRHLPHERARWGAADD
jgi:hypothetical protein